LKICKDTVIIYTLEDNRKIAILLKQGEYDAAMCKSLKNIVVGQDTLINNLKHTLYNLTNQANVYKQSIADLEKSNKDMLKDLKKYMRNSAKWAKIGGVSIGLNVVFLTLLILI
jgi:hypothetical protein